jgi:hypothetical protein
MNLVKFEFTASGKKTWSLFEKKMYSKINKVKNKLNDKFNNELNCDKELQWNDFWGFEPKFNKNKPGELSLHAYGMAVDVKPKCNPLIKGKYNFRILKLITGLDCSKKIDTPNKSTENVYEVLSKASNDFKLKFMSVKNMKTKIKELKVGIKELEAANKAKGDSTDPDESVDEGSSEEQEELVMAKKLLDMEKKLLDMEKIESDIKKDKKGKELTKIKSEIETDKINFDLWKINGFLTIKKEFVLAMVNGEIRWGGEFPNVKDLHHFEI